MAEAARSVESSVYTAGSSGSTEDLLLLEESIDTGLNELLERYNPAQPLAETPTDLIGDRYRINTAQRLPQFDSGTAQAYAAHHINKPELSLIAMVCDPYYPYRLRAIEALRGSQNINMQSLRDFGLAKISHLDDGKRMVLIFDRPQGLSLSDIFKEGRRFTDRQTIDQLLRPVANAITLLQEKGYCHGGINPRNIFIDQQLVLRECLSEPQGMSQDYFYEPIERLLADPIAKGNATSKADAYAMGMLAFEAMFGLEQIRENDRESYTRMMLETGSYHMHVARYDFSEAFSDFFRGIFTENKQERWSMEHVRNWLTGKRYNLILPSLPNEASRPFEFCERQYFSSRALANAIFNNWSVANKSIRKSKLDRWLEMSAHKIDMGEHVARIIRSFGGDYSGNERNNSEMLSRLITAIDPTGPIRVKSISVNVDGLGIAVAHAYKNRDQNALNLLLDVIEWDLPNYWADLSESEKTKSVSETLWFLQRVRAHFKLRQVGFGMERMIYDLNPTLPCQHELLFPYHVTTLEEGLIVLDNLARDCAKRHSLGDRHLAGFFASKIDLNKEIMFKALNKLPKLKEHTELMTLKIISMAQEKHGNIRLHGLACWAAIRIDGLTEHINNRQLRKKIKQNLKAAAKTGLVARVIAVLTENELTSDDYVGFNRAAILYDHNNGKIEALQNAQAIHKLSADLGGRMAMFLAYTILSITICILVDQYHISFGH